MPGDSADDLYGLPLERFIPERAALAKTLRGQKRREEATSVAGMRKPSGQVSLTCINCGIIHLCLG
ncbi:MAG: hypothetical protein QOF83_445 [Solirubrobacteraceae bacterium]|jgi:hypothetical protein|nr:hypothetical protein [Solirubrobacteraceae bacterium]